MKQPRRHKSTGREQKRPPPFNISRRENAQKIHTIENFKKKKRKRGDAWEGARVASARTRARFGAGRVLRLIQNLLRAAAAGRVVT